VRNAGYGYKKVEMHFLPDVWVKCKACQGMRQPPDSGDHLQAPNIADVLDMDVQQALQFFANHP
jgi:excinuclease ABC subunit A